MELGIGHPKDWEKLSVLEQIIAAYWGDNRFDKKPTEIRIGLGLVGFINLDLRALFGDRARISVLKHPHLLEATGEIQQLLGMDVTISPDIPADTFQFCLSYKAKITNG